MANGTAFDLTEQAYRDGATEQLDLLKAGRTPTQIPGALAQAVQRTPPPRRFG